MIGGRSKKGGSRSVTLIILALILGVVLLTEWRQRIVLDRQLGDRESLIHHRHQVLALERELLLARSDEAEILSAGRASLVDPLLGRLDRAAAELAALAADPSLQLVRANPGSLGPASFEPLELAVDKYRQSVDAELELLAKIGLLGQSGELVELRALEAQLLARDGIRRGALLELQVLERDFVATLRTSKALALLEKVDTLRRAPGTAGELDVLLGEYRDRVDAAMSDALALELLRSESSLRFGRLPPMFRQVEAALDQGLEDHLVRITRQRRDARWTTAGLLIAALLTLAFRMRRQWLENLRLQLRIASLADGMKAFADGAEEGRLDLPRSGRLGAVTDSFLSMAGQIRSQISTISDERNRAEEALRTKSDFLARVSHELRTPLHGILGMAELLGQSRLDDRQEHLARSISKSGSTLLSVVNDLLDYSKLEAGKLVLIEHPFDLVKLCETQLAIHAAAAHGKGLELVLTAPHGPLPVTGDPLRLGQVLTNLLGNAVKFTQEGFVELRLDRRESGHELAVELSVRDTGPGIPEATRPMVFESFAQAAPVSRRRQGGTGLGLSIVQEILELMDGTVRVEDPPSPGQRGGPGIVFIAALALRRADAAEARPSPLEGRSLLYVEAHGEVARAQSARLAETGLRLERRPGARAALEAGLPEVEAALVGVPAGGDPRVPELCRQLGERGVPTVVLLPSGEWNRKREYPGVPLARLCRLAEIEASLAELLGLSPGEAPAPEPAIQSAVHLGGRILLVEDNPISRNLVQLMLEDTGCEVVAEENGRLAVERLEAEPFDLVIMDCHMPEMDGFEATRRIRQLAHEDRRKVPVLALTASALEADKRQCEEAGMDQVLCKPISQLELLEALESWLAAEREALHDSGSPAAGPSSVAGEDLDAG